MHDLPVKPIHALDVRPLGLIELSHRAHQEVAINRIPFTKLGVLAPLRHAYLCPPLLGAIIPSCFIYSRVEADVLVEIVLLGDADEVGENLLLAGVLSSPGRILGEGVGVESRPDVAAAARVLVVVPGATEAGGLLKDDLGILSGEEW